MHYSTLVGKTIRDTPKAVRSAAQQLFIRGGFIRPSAENKMVTLPLGNRVFRRLHSMIEECIESLGGQFVQIPIQNLQSDSLKLPEDTVTAKNRIPLWHQWIRFQSESIHNVSYKELPALLSQDICHIDESDEKRAFLSLMVPLRQWTVSFSDSKESICEIQNNLKSKIHDMVQRFDIQALIIPEVRSDDDSLSEALVIPYKNGETDIALCDKCGYAAAWELAESRFSVFDQDSEMKPMTPVLGEGLINVNELAPFLGIPVTQTTKAILFRIDDRVVEVCVRGDYDVSEKKLVQLLQCDELFLADPYTVQDLTSAEVGYAGPMGLPESVEILWDHTTQGRVNFEAGANKTNYHCINVNFGRDVDEPTHFIDVRQVKEGEGCPKCDGILQKESAVRIARLNSIPTGKYENSRFIGREGKPETFHIGFCDVNLTQLLGAIVTHHYDENGVVWPDQIAPYQVHLISLGGGEENASILYHKLTELSIPVLWDDRKESTGRKFADADLIGIPHRVVVSKRTGENVEWKRRDADKAEILSVDEFMQIIQ